MLSCLFCQKKIPTGFDSLATSLYRCCQPTLKNVGARRVAALSFTLEQEQVPLRCRPAYSFAATASGSSSIGSYCSIQARMFCFNTYAVKYKSHMSLLQQNLNRHFLASWKDFLVMLHGAPDSATDSALGSSSKRLNPCNVVFEKFGSGKSNDPVDTLKESRDTFLDVHARGHCVLGYPFG